MTGVLAGFVSYAVHALTGAIPGMLPTESAEGASYGPPTATTRL